MKTRPAFCAMATLLWMVVSMGSAPPSAGAGEPFAVKPGAWEMIVTTQTTGTLIPPDVLAQLPPERRARVEESMKARAARPKTHIAKECLTQEDLDQHNILKEAEDEDNDGHQCTTKVLSKTSRKVELEKTCSGPSPASTHVMLEAKSMETIAATIDMDRPGSGTVHSEMKGRWLSASCAGVSR